MPCFFLLTVLFPVCALNPSFKEMVGVELNFPICNCSTHINHAQDFGVSLIQTLIPDLSPKVMWMCVLGRQTGRQACGR